jgi:mRNA interferase RelE/StbE
MNVEFHPDVYKQLQQLPRPVFAAALRMIVSLTREPRPVGVKKLVGGPNDWRVRIGEYRTVYAIDGDTVVVMQVRHRRTSTADRERATGGRSRTPPVAAWARPMRVRARSAQAAPPADDHADQVHGRCGRITSRSAHRAEAVAGSPGTPP